MTEQLDRSEIDAKREELLTGLSFAKQRLRQVSEAAVEGKASPEDLAEADQSVRGFERLLEGVGFVEERLTAEEKEREDAKRAAQRRAAAVEILSLVHERYWATEKLDQVLAAIGPAKDHIESLGQQIVSVSSGFFDGGLRGQGDLRNFLMNIDLLDLTDTIYRLNQAELARPGRYAQHLILRRPTALNALATAIPEVNDEEVIKEALAKARREAEERNGESNDDQNS